MKYRKKPVVIEAIQFDGTNYKDIKANFCDKIYTVDPKVIVGDNKNVIFIPTLEGVMIASVDDWIIKGIAGEFYPCKPDIFEKTYEKVE